MTTPDRPPVASVNPHVVRDWADACVAGLEELRGEINDLNVFPIPDSDTGSNMLFTMRAAAEAARATPDEADLATVTRAMADGAVSSARGNSGIILSQVLVGLADAADVLTADHDATFNHLYSLGLRLAARGAIRAVSNPREGTVLTVIAVAAQTAAQYVGASPADLARAVADDTAEALERTPEQMPELASAGVVDAGARGFLVLADALVGVLTGAMQRRRRYRGILTGGGEPGHSADEACASSDMDYEVMFLLDGAAGEHVATLRTRLGEIGDAVVIVGDSSGDAGERFSVHVHTNEPGAAVEAGIERGALSDIRISCFALDEIKKQTVNDGPPPRHKRAVVAVVRGEGAAELFADAGAAVVRADDGLTPEKLADAIRGTDSAHVVVMANGAMSSPDLVSVTSEVRSPQRAVVSLPTLSMTQCLAALAVHDPTESPDADAYAMAEAAAGARWGSLTIAETKMMTLAGTCEVGDILGLIGSDVLVVADRQPEAATALVDLMLATGGEMVTVLAGAQIADDTVAVIDEHLRRSYPGVELLVYPTGQQDDLIQVGVE